MSAAVANAEEPAPAAESAQPATASVQINIDEFLTLTANASEHNEVDNKVHLSGNVRITLKHFVLETDDLIVDKTAGIIRSDGDLYITTNNLRFHGKGLEYDYVNKKGTLRQAEVSIQGFNLNSQMVEISPDSILLTQVIASTCPPETRDYHIFTKQMQLMPDGTAHLRNISFFYRHRKIFSLPKYSMRLATQKSNGGKSKKTAEPGHWAFSAPKMGYARFGGLELRSGFHHVRGEDTAGLYFDYYLHTGMFTEARWRHTPKQGKPEIGLRLGKQFKENTGYFRNTSPQVVWNGPTADLLMPKRYIMKTRLLVGANIETGRLKEIQTKNYLSRFYAKIDAAYPINPAQRVKLSLIGDDRFMLYNAWHKYRVLGLGINSETGNADTSYMRIGYMFFSHTGSTPFLSDLVNTNDKLFFYGITPIRGRTRAYIDSQYDLNLHSFDEIIYGAVRQTNCLKFRFAFHSKTKQVSLNMDILNPGRK